MPNHIFNGQALSKVLVTGGAGFLGLAICRRLRERGLDVVSVQRKHSGALQALGVQQVLLDLGDKTALSTLNKTMHGCTAVFHNAAKAGHWGSYGSYYAINVTGTEQIIEACRSAGIAKLIYTSTPSVAHRGRIACEGGNEINTPYATHFKAHYPLTKQIAEKAVLAANSAQLATVALRPRLIWGPGDNNLLPRIVERAQAGRLRFIGGGQNRMDSTYIDNAAQAHIDALDRLAPGNACAGRAYFISDGQPQPVIEIINAWLSAAKQPPVNASVPFVVAYTAGVVCEALWHTLPLRGEPPMTRFVAEQLSTPHWYDISAANHDFAYRPQVSFDEGLDRLAAWWDSDKLS